MIWNNRLKDLLRSPNKTPSQVYLMKVMWVNFQLVAIEKKVEDKELGNSNGVQGQRVGMRH